MGESLDWARDMGADVMTRQQLQLLLYLEGLPPVLDEVSAATALPTVAPKVRLAIGDVSPEETARVERAAQKEFFIPGC